MLAALRRLQVELPDSSGGRLTLLAHQAELDLAVIIDGAHARLASIVILTSSKSELIVHYHNFCNHYQLGKPTVT
jgi:hypothetical protein